MITIGLSDTLGSEHKFQQYITWLESGDPGIKHEVLSYRKNNFGSIDRCDGLLLTGGHDVDPAYYGGAVGHPKITDVDPRRDEFEGKLLDTALERGIPILGICRGLQLANVHLGGTLLPDLEEAGYQPHKNISGESRHAIEVEPGSFLASVAGGTAGDVNSNHHQAVAKVAGRLKVAARSGDGVIEALEMTGCPKTQFFLLVQYHPERMTDTENPFARNVLTMFLQSLTITHSHFHIG